MSISTHLLVVGSLGRCGGLLHESAPDLRVSVLCDEAELADLPGIENTDQVLALAPGASWDHELALVRDPQVGHPVTHVAAFTAGHYRHAAWLARELDVPWVPRLADRPIPPGLISTGRMSLPRITTDGAVEMVVPVLAEDGEAAVIALVRRHRTTTDGADLTIDYVVSRDLLPPDASQSVVRHALATADGFGLRLGVATLTVLWDGTRPMTVDVDVALPWTSVVDIITAATGIDLARCLARQAVGKPVLAEVRRQLADEAKGAICVWLVREPAGSWTCGNPPEVQGIDIAESHPSGAVTVELVPTLRTADPNSVLALVWARAGDADRAVAIAREAAGSIGFATGENRVPPSEPRSS